MKREKFWNELEFKPIRKPLGHLISRRRPAAQPNGKRREKKTPEHKEASKGFQVTSIL